MMRIQLSALAVACAILLGGCVTATTADFSSTRLRNSHIPMYGVPETIRSEEALKADEEFVAQNIEKFGSKQKASQAWWVEGDKLLRSGDSLAAMSAYNQAWVINPDNYQAYWGFGRVSLHWDGKRVGKWILPRDRLDQAIAYMEKAVELVNDPYQEVALLSDLGNTYTHKGLRTGDSSYFAKADSVYAKSTQMDPSYENVWRRWAASLYDRGDYKGAWKKVQEAKRIGSVAFSREFIVRLDEKMTRP